MLVASAISGHIDKLPTLYIPGTKEPLNPGLASLSCSILAAVIISATVASINGAIDIPQIPRSKNQLKP
ncbi:MAG: hypothetical protein HC916_11040 [Coleofasciculaceae cyanobacterium SM2_1_6]|nr:hypothetical protein [Coleofasciculaceae cyanobacterium SM2_1_6]